MERERERGVIGESASSWINSLRFVNYYRPPRLVDIRVYIYIYIWRGRGWVVGEGGGHGGGAKKTADR